MRNNEVQNLAKKRRRLHDSSSSSSSDSDVTPAQELSSTTMDHRKRINESNQERKRVAAIVDETFGKNKSELILTRTPLSPLSDEEGICFNCLVSSDTLKRDPLGLESPLAIEYLGHHNHHCSGGSVVATKPLKERIKKKKPRRKKKTLSSRGGVGCSKKSFLSSCEDDSENSEKEVEEKEDVHVKVSREYQQQRQQDPPPPHAQPKHSSTKRNQETTTNANNSASEEEEKRNKLEKSLRYINEKGIGFVTKGDKEVSDIVLKILGHQHHHNMSDVILKLVVDVLLPFLVFGCNEKVSEGFVAPIILIENGEFSPSEIIRLDFNHLNKPHLKYRGQRWLGSFNNSIELTTNKKVAEEVFNAILPKRLADIKRTKRQHPKVKSRDWLFKKVYATPTTNFSPSWVLRMPGLETVSRLSTATTVTNTIVGLNDERPVSLIHHTASWLERRFKFLYSSGLNACMAPNGARFDSTLGFVIKFFNQSIHALKSYILINYAPIAFPTKWNSSMFSTNSSPLSLLQEVRERGFKVLTASRSILRKRRSSFQKKTTTDDVNTVPNLRDGYNFLESFPKSFNVDSTCDDYRNANATTNLIARELFFENGNDPHRRSFLNEFHHHLVEWLENRDVVWTFAGDGWISRMFSALLIASFFKSVNVITSNMILTENGEGFKKLPSSFKPINNKKASLNAPNFIASELVILVGNVSTTSRPFNYRLCQYVSHETGKPVVFVPCFSNNLVTSAAVESSYCNERDGFVMWRDVSDMSSISIAALLASLPLFQGVNDLKDVRAILNQREVALAENNRDHHSYVKLSKGKGIQSVGFNGRVNNECSASVVTLSCRNGDVSTPKKNVSRANMFFNLQGKVANQQQAAAAAAAATTKLKLRTCIRSGCLEELIKQLCQEKPQREHGTGTNTNTSSSLQYELFGELSTSSSENEKETVFEPQPQPQPQARYNMKRKRYASEGFSTSMSSYYPDTAALSSPKRYNRNNNISYNSTPLTPMSQRYHHQPHRKNNSRWIPRRYNGNSGNNTFRHGRKLVDYGSGPFIDIDAPPTESPASSNNSRRGGGYLNDLRSYQQTQRHQKSITAAVATTTMTATMVTTSRRSVFHPTTTHNHS